MILRYLLIFFSSHILLKSDKKNASKFLRTEPVKCPARAVIAWHVHVMTLNLLTRRKSPLIKLFDKQGLHSSRTTDESLHFTVLPCHLRKCRRPVYIVIQSLKDISYDQNFLQISTRNFEIRRQVLRIKIK